VNPYHHERLAIPASYKTPRYVTHIYTPVNVLAVIGERKKSTQKLKDPLSFEILIFRNGQPDRDDDSIIFVDDFNLETT